IESSSGIIYLKDFKKRLSLNQKNFKKELLEELDKGFVPLNLNELYTKHNIKEEDKNKLLNYLNEENEVILLNDGVILSKDTFNFGIDEIYKHFRKNKTLSLGECRDILKTNRKIALSFLEELDNRKITKRGEKDRVLL
ncbi:SelB domain-containing protein, partial [Clostridium chrysemydis]